MKVERKLLGGILVLGALGLGVDRLFFAAKPVVADETESYAATTTATTPLATLTTTGEKLARAAAAVLPTGTADRDAFAVTVAPAKATKKSTDDLAVTFAAKHRLTAVVVDKSGNRGGALVDGKLVTVGQSVGGLRLAAVSADSATFTTGSDSVTLRMPLSGATVAGVQ